MNDFETKIKIVDYKDYSEEEFNDILYNGNFITKKEYENKIRQIKLKRLNNEKKNIT